MSWSGLTCGWGLTFFQVQFPRQGTLSKVRSWNYELEQNYIFLSTQVQSMGSWWERQHRRNQQDQSSTAGSEGSLSRNNVRGQSRWPVPPQMSLTAGLVPWGCSKASGFLGQFEVMKSQGKIIDTNKDSWREERNGGHFQCESQSITARFLEVIIFFLFFRISH